jgi:hypothetical protein
MVIFRKLPMEQLGSTFRQLGSAAASDFKTAHYCRAGCMILWRIAERFLRGVKKKRKSMPSGWKCLRE